MSADWQFLVSLNEHIRPLRDPLAIQTAAVRLLGEHLQVNRVHYARIDGDDWVIEHSYVNGVQPFPARGSVSLFSTVGSGLRRGESVVVEDIQADPRLSAEGRSRLGAREVGAAVIIPLIKEGGWLAVLSVHTRIPRAWTRDEVALIEVTADRVWSSAERARTEEVLGRSDHRRAFMQRLNAAIRPLGEPARILTEACRLLGTHLRVNRVVFGEIADDDVVVAAEYDDGVPSLPGRFPWRALGGSREDEIVSGACLVCHDTASDSRSAANREALEAAGIGAYIAPILIKDGRWGAVFGIHSIQPRVWTEDEIGLAQEVVDRVWATIEHRKAEAEIRANEERVTFVLRVNDTLRQLTDPGEVQAAAARLLAEYLGVTRVSYVEAEGRHYVIRREYASGVQTLAGEQPFAIASPELGGAFLRGETVAVNDVQADPRFSEDERAALRRREYAAFVSVTIPIAGRVQAAVCVNHHAPRTWTSGEIDLIRSVAERTWSAVERTRAEAALRQQALQLTLALDASAAGSWTWDRVTGRFHWDERFRALYGVAADEPAGLDTWASRVHHEDRHRLLARLEEITTNRTLVSFEETFRIVRPDGSRRWVQSRGQAERDAEGGVLALTGLDLDFTQHQRTEEALQARREEEHDRALRMLLETATQGVVSVDREGTILSANQALEQMFGWAKGELLGLQIERLIPGAFHRAHVEHRAAYFASPHARLMAGGLPLVGERRDGSRFPIEVSLNHVGMSGGARAFAFVTDITERERAATALQERTRELESRTLQLRRMASDLTLAEQNAREQIAKTLHDGLQQMLVLVSLDIEQQIKRDTQAGTGPSEVILHARRHLDEAIGAARSLNVELFPPVLQRSALPVALSWLAGWLQSKYKIAVLVTADPRANSARKDVRTLLFESVRELLFNAVKHAHVDRVALDLALDAEDRLCITVSDEGIGFDPAALESRSIEGEVGWGLFSIRERLALLGGHLEIASAPGKGTRFRLVAPRGREDDSAPMDSSSLDRVPPPPVAEVNDAEALRILIVDDHAGVRVALRQLLSERPQFVVVGDAANGIEAIAQARALGPHAIVMDVSMPEMDGIEATRRIRAAHPEIQIFGLSMEPRPATIHPIVEAGAAGFFVKGIDTQQLIDRLLAAHGSRSIVLREPLR